MKTIKKQWIALLVLLASWPATEMMADTFYAWVNAFAHIDGVFCYPDPESGNYYMYDDGNYYYFGLLYPDCYYDEETGEEYEYYYIYGYYEYDEWGEYGEFVEYEQPLGPFHRNEERDLEDEDGNIVAWYEPEYNYYEDEYSWDSLRLTFKVTDPVKKTCEVSYLDRDELLKGWKYDYEKEEDEEFWPEDIWSYIEYIEIPETVARYENGREVKYTVTGIGDRAFQGNHYDFLIYRVYLPESIKRIEDRAFADGGPDWFESEEQTFFCNIPSQLEYIGDYAFLGCKGSSLVIPASVSHIGTGAFADCYLKSIEVSTDNPTYDSREGCNSIIETATNTLLVGSNDGWIPQGIEKIGNYAFLGNYLQSLELPQSLLSIGEYAFGSDYNGWGEPRIHEYQNEEEEPMLRKRQNQTGGRGVRQWYGEFRNVIIPQQVREIGNGAFYYCDLDTIVSLVATPFHIDEDVFNYWNYYDGMLMVPSPSVEQYLTTESWNQFQNVQGLGSWKKGDVNSDGKVNVLDLAALVNYINGRLPALFIREAANLWEDDKINVQDVVCLVSQLMDLGENRRQSTIGRHVAQETAKTEACVGCHGAQLVIESEKDVSAFDIIIDDASAFQVSQDFRQAGMTCQTRQIDRQVHLIGYSLTGNVLPAGEHVIGVTDSQQSTVVNAMLADQDAVEIATSINNETTDVRQPARNADEGNVYQIAVGADAVILIKTDGTKHLKHHSSSSKDFQR